MFRLRSPTAESVPATQRRHSRPGLPDMTTARARFASFIEYEIGQSWIAGPNPDRRRPSGHLQPGHGLIARRRKLMPDRSRARDGTYRTGLRRLTSRDRVHPLLRGIEQDGTTRGVLATRVKWLHSYADNPAQIQLHSILIEISQQQHSEACRHPNKNFVTTNPCGTAVRIPATAT